MPDFETEEEKRKKARMHGASGHEHPETAEPSDAPVPAPAEKAPVEDLPHDAHRKRGGVEKKIAGAITMLGMTAAFIGAVVATGGVITLPAIAIVAGATLAGGFVSGNIGKLAGNLGRPVDATLDAGESVLAGAVKGAGFLVKPAAALVTGAAVAAGVVMAAPALAGSALAFGGAAAVGSLLALSGKENAGSKYGMAAGMAVGAVTGIAAAAVVGSGLAGLTHLGVGALNSRLAEATFYHFSDMLTSVGLPKSVAGVTVAMGTVATAVTAAGAAVGATLGGTLDHVRDWGRRLRGYPSEINPPELPQISRKAPEKHVTSPARSVSTQHSKDTDQMAAAPAWQTKWGNVAGKENNSFVERELARAKNENTRGLG